MKIVNESLIFDHSDTNLYPQRSGKPLELLEYLNNINSFGLEIAPDPTHFLIYCIDDTQLLNVEVAI